MCIVYHKSLYFIPLVYNIVFTSILPFPHKLNIFPENTLVGELENFAICPLNHDICKTSLRRPWYKIHTVQIQEEAVMIGNLLFGVTFCMYNVCCRREI